MARLNSVFKFEDRADTLYFSSFENAKAHLARGVAGYRAKGSQLLSSKSSTAIPCVWRSKIHFPWSGRIFEITIEEIELDIIPKRDSY